VPLHYDFQALYKRIQALLPRIGDGSVVDPDVTREVDKIERELARIHEDLSRLEQDFPPSLLRKFFDHLKNQDEKILFALVKFYLFEPSPQRDTWDKLDILLTRLSELTGESEISRVRDIDELRSSFEHLADLVGIPVAGNEETRTLVAVIRDMRDEILEVDEFRKLIDCQIVDRFRELKGRLGRDAMNPDVLVEIVTTNIALKNKFRELYQQEEVRILEDTNRIFEIERYIERNPGLAHDDLRRQLEVFKASRKKFDRGRKENNLRREDVVALRSSMEGVIRAFEPGGGAQLNQPTAVPDGSDPFFSISGESAADPVEEVRHEPQPEAEVGAVPEWRESGVTEAGTSDAEPADIPVLDDHRETPPEELAAPVPFADRTDDAFEVEELDEVVDPEMEKPGILDILPQDPLLTTALHKIVFALELVVWDYPPEQAARAKELHYMRLEPWEVGAYRVLMDTNLLKETLPWKLQVFFLTSAALRVKMEEEWNGPGMSIAGSAGSSTTCFSRAIRRSWNRYTVLISVFFMPIRRSGWSTRPPEASHRCDFDVGRESAASSLSH